MKNIENNLYYVCYNLNDCKGYFLEDLSTSLDCHAYDLETCKEIQKRALKKYDNLAFYEYIKIEKF